METAEVITEFRRLVLIAEDHLRRTDWMFTQSPRSAREELTPFAGRVTLVVRLTFSPLNTYADVPKCDVIIGGAPDVEMLDARLTPVNSQPFKTQGGGQATRMVGAVVELDLAAASVGAGNRPVTVFVDGREVARFELDLSRIE